MVPDGKNRLGRGKARGHDQRKGRRTEPDVPKLPLRIALFPDRTHPYESVFSLKLKVSTWNSISEARLATPFRKRTIIRKVRFIPQPGTAPPGELFGASWAFAKWKRVVDPPRVSVGPPDVEAMLEAFQVPPNLHIRTTEALFGDFHVPEVVSGGVRICPKCFSMGYHFPLFQLRMLDRCPQHGIPLRFMEPAELSRSFHPASIPIPPAKPGKKSPWPMGYMRPARKFRCEKIVSATDFIRAMVARREHLVGSFVAEVTRFKEDDSLRFSTMTLYRRGPNKCALEKFCAALIHYGSGDGQPPPWLTVPPLDRVTIKLPDRVRAMLCRNGGDDSSIPATRFYWEPADLRDSLHKYRGPLAALIERYADVGAALQAWCNALKRFRAYFEGRHGRCLVHHLAARPATPPCAEAEAFVRMWHGLTQPPEAHSMFRMAADDIAAALLYAGPLRRLPRDARVRILELILEETFFSYFQTLYGLQLHFTLKQLKLAQKMKGDIFEGMAHMSRSTTVIEAFCATTLPKLFVDLQHLPNAIQLVRVPFTTIVPPVMETDRHVSEVLERLRSEAHGQSEHANS